MMDTVLLERYILDMLAFARFNCLLTVSDCEYLKKIYNNLLSFYFYPLFG